MTSQHIDRPRREDGQNSGAPTSPIRRMWVWAGAHAADDFFQGLVPAAIPYFVVDRGIGYLGASGLTLAATLGSALPQLLFGVIADRRRVLWMAPTGVALAAIGAGSAGLVSGYPLVFLMLVLSGLGVAMFHPPAGRDARTAAAGSTTAMSYFAVGGSIGFFVAPAVATPALEAWGVGATSVFVPPAVLVAFVLVRHQRRTLIASSGAIRLQGVDRRCLFAALTLVEVVRSIVSLGINTFVALYWITDLGASSALGGIALTSVLGGGVAGALLGGRIADRIGMVRTVQIGNAMLPTALVALLLCPDKYAALPLATLVGVSANIPFAVLITLGQDYLPSRPATAAGVTLGLAMSAGGLFMPVLGLIADGHGPRGALVVLTVLPVLAAALSTMLRSPVSERGACALDERPTEGNTGPTEGGVRHAAT